MSTTIALIWAALAALHGFLQTPSGSPLAAQLLESDWGVSSWAAVRQGQLGVIHDRGGDRLAVYLVTTTPRQTDPGVVRRATPAYSDGTYVVSEFDSGLQNRVGGYFNSFSSPGAFAATAIRRGEDGRTALTLDYRKSGSGFGGMWIHLFDFKEPIATRVYFDSTPFSLLSFWVRRFGGNAQVLLKVSDARWEYKEDAVPVGDVAGFLPGGSLTSEWKQALIPLRSFPAQVDRRELAGLVFEVFGSGEGSVAIKDLAFSAEGTRPPPLSPVSDRVEPRSNRRKALWVWNTGEILADHEQQVELAKFATRLTVTDLFLQLPNDESQIGPSGEIRLDTGKWRTFLALLSANGLRAFALDGFKNYALPDWHERVLMTVDNVARFNRSAAAGERFFGVRYDVEPYLLPGFLGERRTALLRGYLELLRKISMKTRAEGLVFGVDIPFWFDSADEVLRKPFALEFNGALKSVSEHVIDLVDEVSVMDYRTTAYGADGTIALARGELAYAAKHGKQVFVGMETTELPDEDLIVFDAEPAKGIPAVPPRGRCVVLAPGARTADVWLASGTQWEAVRQTLADNGRDPRTVLWWPVGKTIPVPSHKLTFARLGKERLDRTMAEAEEEFPRYASFAGYAIHDYLGYRRLLGVFPNSK